jgi:hypothetical protein
MNRFLTIMLMAIAVFMVFALTSCSKVKARLESGEEIECQMYEARSCGYSFFRCDSGHSYECETNVTWIKR